MAASLKKISQKTLQKSAGYANHAQVYQFEDPETSLKGYIAIHQAGLKSAIGGTRFYPYQTEAEALNDVLNLSKQMTYKCAIAGVPYGGAKAVIIGDPNVTKNRALLEAYAKIVAQLEGSFYTGPDVGTSQLDIQTMLAVAPFFVGKAESTLNAASEYTSLTIYLMIKAAVKLKLGKNNLNNLALGIKGLGKVGMGLLKLLEHDQANIFAADAENQKISKAKEIHSSLEILDADQLFQHTLDIYSPCALGNEFTLNNIQKFKASIICGGANNQILNDEVSELLHQKGVLYIPDYLANAGALISATDELEVGGYQKDRVMRRIQNLVTTFNQLYLEAEKQKKSLAEVTRKQAESFFLTNT